MRLLYLIKDPPFDPRGHAAQRAHALIREWNSVENVQITFFFPGPATQARNLGSAEGFEVSAARTFGEKVAGIFLPYHFRMVGRIFQKEVLRLASPHSFDAIVAEELTMAREGVAIARDLNLPLFYIAHNFELLLHRQISSGFLNFIQGKFLKLFEKKILHQATRVFAFSHDDAVRMMKVYGHPSIKTTRAGVDLNAVKHLENRDQAQHILIVGAMDYAPNIESVVWFAKTIYPMLKRPYPVIVAGRNPAEAVKLACSQARFELAASPADMNEVLAKGIIEVVPLKKGSGTRGKILEAMAAGLPIVSTSLGCEGLGLEADRHVLVEDDERAFARAVDRLMDNPGLRHELSQQAYAKVQDFSYRTLSKELLAEFAIDL